LICNKTTKSICCPRKLEEEVVVRGGLSLNRNLSKDFLPGLRDKCGLPPGDSQFIVGGEDAKAGEFPWAALIGTTRRFTTNINGRKERHTETRWGCGGILINRWFVLTAAHCHGKGGRRITKVRLGEYQVAGSFTDNLHGLPKEQEFTIARDAVFVHEQYNVTQKNGKNELFNDVALVKLPSPVEFNAGTAPVCLPWDTQEYREELEVENFDSDLEDKKNGVVVGWGFTSGYDPWLGDTQQDTQDYGTGSRLLQKLRVPILSSATCRAAWTAKGKKPRAPSKNQVCAGGERGKSSCKGDSGGGLFIQNPKGDNSEFGHKDSAPYYLLGIVSLGSKFCGDGTPGIYTRVEEYIPWIRKVLQSQAKLR